MGAATQSAAAPPPPPPLRPPAPPVPPAPPAPRRDLSALVAPIVPGMTDATPETEAPAAAAAQAKAPEIAELAPQIARAKAIAVTKTAPSRRLQAGDLICGTCGEGNPSTRRFCSRCGSSLVAAVTVRESWWRRLLRKIMPRRGPKVVALGTGADGRTESAVAELAKPGFDFKHAFRRFMRIARVVVAMALLFGGIVYGAYPPFRNAVNHWVTSLKSDFNKEVGANLAPIHPVSVAANITDKGSAALNASDENTNTYWLAPWSSSTEPVITLDFTHRVTLERMILHSGADGGAFVQHGRPASLLLTYSNGETQTITPQDTAQQQTFDLNHALAVSSVQIKITGIDPGTLGSDVAITEIELFGVNL
jgi:hypothetical protein